MNYKIFRSAPRGTPSLAVVTFLALLALPGSAAAQPSFSKSFDPATIGSGSASRLVFTIENGSGAPVTDMAFTDILPAGVTLAAPAVPNHTCDSGTLTAPDGGSTITFTGGEIAGEASCSVEVLVTSTAAGTHINVSGDLTSNADNSGSATADLTVVTDRPGFTKSFSPSLVPFGGRSTLTFTIDNSANGSAASNLSFSDELPAGLEVADPAGASTTCTGGVLTASPGSATVSYSFAFSGDATVDAGSICTVTVDVVPVGIGFLDNLSDDLASVVSFTARSSGLAVDTLESTAGDIVLIKEFLADPVPPGDTVDLEFTIFNRTRSDDATDVSFVDDLEAALSGLEATSLPMSACGGTLSGTSTLTFTGGTVAASSECSFTVTLQVPAGAAPGVYPNTTSNIEADFGFSEPSFGNQATDDLFVFAAPVLTKRILDAGTLNPISSVPAGEDVILEFEITNSSSTSDATDIEFEDNLTAFLPGLTVATPLAEDPCGGGSALSASTDLTGILTLALNGGSLPTDGSCTFQVTAQIPGEAPVNLYTNVTSEVTATVGGETVAGPPGEADLTVLAPPAFSKSFLSGAPPGGTVDLQFNLQLSENAPGPATDISFTDDLFATLNGLTAVTLPADGFCGAGSQMTGTDLLSVTGVTLEPGVSCSFEATLQVPVEAIPGEYPNTTSAVSATMDGTAVDGPAATADLRLIGLQLLKSFPDSPSVAGGTATLRFVLDNSASSLAASGISFNDDLGNVISGMTATELPADDFCGTGSQATQSGDVVTVSGASLAVGDTCTFELTVQVPAGTAAGFYNNRTSQITANINAETEFLPPADAQLEIIDPLAISKAFIDDPVAPGETVALEFTLMNNSPTDSATGLTFTDDLDAVLAGMSATGVPADGFCGAGSQATGGGVLSVTGANLAPATFCTFQVTVLVPAGASAGTTVTNNTSALSGEVGGTATSASPASDELRIDLVDLSKSFAGPVGAGGTVVLSFQVENQSTSAVGDLSFTDDLGATLSGLQAVSLPASPCGAGSSITGASVLTVTGGSLAAGESCSFDVTLQVPAGAAPGIYPNTTSGLTSQGQPLGTAASADLQVEPAPAFDKTFSPTTVLVGDVSVLTFNIDNGASVISADDLDFTDNLPAGLEVASPPSASTTCTGGTLTAVAGAASLSYTGGSVAAGATCTVSLDIAGNTPGSQINTSGALTSSLGNSGTAGASLEVLAPLLTLQKEFLGTPVAGDTIDLRFTVTNDFAEPLSDIAFNDDLDAVVPGLEASGLPQTDVCGIGSQVAGTSVISFTGGVLPTGGECSFTVTLQLPPDLAPGQYSNVTSAVSFIREGVVLEVDPAVADLQVEPPPAFTKAFAPDVIGVDEVSTLTFTIDNAESSIDAGDLAFTDTLPAGTTVASTPEASNGCDGTLTAAADSGTIELSGGSVPAGDACTVSVDVTASTEGSYTNVSDALTSSLGDSGTASAVLQVADTDINVGKAFSSQPVIPGGLVDLEITIGNSSEFALEDIALSDDLDAVLAGLAAEGLPLDDVCGTGSQVTGAGVVDLAGGSLQAGESCTIIIPVRVPGDAASGTYANTTGAATGTREGLAVQGPTASADLVVETLGFEKTIAPQDVGAGATVDITFVINNPDPVNSAEGLTFTDDLDVFVSGMTTSDIPQPDACGAGSLLDGSPVVQLSDGIVSPSSSCTITVTTNVPADATSGDFTNQTSALEGQVGGTAFNAASASAPLGVQGAPSFTKAFTPEQVGPGETSTLTFTIDNSASTFDADSLAFVDPLPSGMQVASEPNVSNDCGGTLSATAGSGSISLTDGSVAAGSQCTISVDVISRVGGTRDNVTDDLTSSLGNSGSASASLVQFITVPTIDIRWMLALAMLLMFASWIHMRKN
ncbi:DUF7933 domain-containing protein [Wenzhouxiangella sp. EGI_FJ10305]|uniref:DUF7933 domain-containing protein n=1 Tax=Wenzhouxiangella sp. EGI_FJ10305 TaxID=3243768 RepID=UPI0035E2114A